MNLPHHHNMEVIPKKAHARGMARTYQVFARTVWSYYRRHGRRSLPWRRTRDPYRILVSEMMLQQTQVPRVLLAYPRFLKRFPTLRSLAEAPLSAIIKEWQGLGYNRRAKLLHACAKIILQTFGGAVPKTYPELVRLPGVGPYTAGAILAFAFDVPTVFIETNIRSVYLHHFFKHQRNVDDAAVMRIIARTLNERCPREWYYALMDYGAHIKKVYGNPNTKSKRYRRQLPFHGSDRQIRGAVLRALVTRPMRLSKLYASLSYEHARIDTQLRRLRREGLVEKRGATYTLPRS